MKITKTHFTNKFVNKNNKHIKHTHAMCTDHWEEKHKKHIPLRKHKNDFWLSQNPLLSQITTGPDEGE